MFWENYGDNELIYYDDRPCLDRFINPININNNVQHWIDGHTEYLLGKSLFRSISTNKINHHHYINYDIQNIYDGNFYNITKLIKKDIKIKEKNIINPYLSIYIKHFRTKSLEEWCWRFNRGDTLVNKDDKQYPYKLNRFWTFNERTPEKEKFMEEYRRNN